MSVVYSKPKRASVTVGKAAAKAKAGTKDKEKKNGR